MRQPGDLGANSLRCVRPLGPAKGHTAPESRADHDEPGALAHPPHRAVRSAAGHSFRC